MVAVVPFRRSADAGPYVATCRNGRRCRSGPEPDLPDAARAVGALLAPVVACLRGDDEGVRVLLDDTCDSGARRVDDVVRAAPAIVRVYLGLAPPPDGAVGHRARVPARRRSSGSAIPSS